MKSIIEKLKKQKIGKEKILLLAVAGILLIIPSYFENIKDKSGQNETETTVINKDISNYENNMEEKVSNLLENINGVSNVKIMISLDTKGTKELQYDSEESWSIEDESKLGNENRTVKKTTVVLSNNGNESPYVIKESYPIVRGIAVTGKGLENTETKSQVINMLSALFNIPVHKISIIEVKGD